MDKVVHSAVGAGVYFAILIVIFFSVKIALLLFVALIAAATAKELIDKARYGKYDIEDLKATLNPFVLFNWYRKQTK